MAQQQQMNIAWRNVPRLNENQQFGYPRNSFQKDDSRRYPNDDQGCLFHPEKLAKYQITPQTPDQEMVADRLFCSTCAIHFAGKGYNVQDLQNPSQYDHNDSHQDQGQDSYEEPISEEYDVVNQDHWEKSRLIDAFVKEVSNQCPYYEQIQNLLKLKRESVAKYYSKQVSRIDELVADAFNALNVQAEWIKNQLETDVIEIMKEYEKLFIQCHAGLKELRQLEKGVNDNKEQIIKRTQLGHFKTVLQSYCDRVDTINQCFQEIAGSSFQITKVQPIEPSDDQNTMSGINIWQILQLQERSTHFIRIGKTQKYHRDEQQPSTPLTHNTQDHDVSFLYDGNEHLTPGDNRTNKHSHEGRQSLVQAEVHQNKYQWDSNDEFKQLANLEQKLAVDGLKIRRNIHGQADMDTCLGQYDQIQQEKGRLLAEGIMTQLDAKKQIPEEKSEMHHSSISTQDLGADSQSIDLSQPSSLECQTRNPTPRNPIIPQGSEEFRQLQQALNGLLGITTTPPSKKIEDDSSAVIHDSQSRVIQQPVLQEANTLDIDISLKNEVQEIHSKQNQNTIQTKMNDLMGGTENKQTSPDFEICDEPQDENRAYTLSRAADDQQIDKPETPVLYQSRDQKFDDVYRENLYVSFENREIFHDLQVERKQDTNIVSNREKQTIQNEAGIQQKSENSHSVSEHLVAHTDKPENKDCPVNIKVQQNTLQESNVASQADGPIMIEKLKLHNDIIIRVDNKGECTTSSALNCCNSQKENEIQPSSITFERFLQQQTYNSDSMDIRKQNSNKMSASNI